jgi:hypothetical protein
MSDNGDDHPQDPHVERLRPVPSQPPQRTRTLIGFLGDSDRPGMRRLYLSESLDYYAEFRTDDVVSLTPIPPEESPFPGHQVTQLMLRHDATIDYTHTHTPKPVDEFDLDVQLGPPQATVPFRPTGVVCQVVYTRPVFCHIVNTSPVICHLWTPGTCNTWCGQQTCTCNTQCGQNTCAQTCTCNTQCEQNTCAQTCTCFTQCGQNTCDKNFCHP